MLFRSGNAYASNGVPFEPWDVATGAGILWRASATNLGFNSPIVWSNRVFLSGAEEQQREVFCYDADTGALVWRRSVSNVPGSPAQMPEVAEGTGQAFTPEVNTRWTAETRPILEAFFHAREFLRLIVHYGRELEAPPQTLPSGWAAVLLLYGLR